MTNEHKRHELVQCLFDKIGSRLSVINEQSPFSQPPMSYLMDKRIYVGICGELLLRSGDEADVISIAESFSVME